MECMDTLQSNTLTHGLLALKEPPCDKELTDKELVLRVLNGYEPCFQVLIHRYYRSIYTVVYRIVKNPTEAEDVTQEACMKAYFQLAMYDNTYKFSTWMLTIGSHLAIDYLRKRRVYTLSLDEATDVQLISDAGLTPEQTLMEKEYKKHVQVYLKQLPPKYRTAIFLRYWRNLSYDEISQSLSISPVVVKARLHRARELLSRMVVD